MKEYFVIVSKDLANLSARVEAYMQAKWSCQGGVAVQNSPGEGVFYMQAMVR